RADLVKLAWWDREENDGRSFPPWRPFNHPQLGPVEIGGIDPRVGIWNPPLHELDELCVAQSRAFLPVAALAPRLVIAGAGRPPCRGGRTRGGSVAKNGAHVGAYGSPAPKNLASKEPVSATASPDGCELVDPGAAHQILGHLDGWGRGLHTGANLPAYPG